jgi:DNA modification methylase
MQLLENHIYRGNCENILREFPENSIDLIYADPPFFTNKFYELIWNDGYEVRAYEDRWKGGIENYIAWMEPKLRECHRVLKAKGSMYLHCDYRANAHLRILMDRIFGHEPLNEIIWHYRTGGVSKRWWAQKSDTILFYAKSKKEWTFNPMQVKVYNSDIYGPDFKPGWKDRESGRDEKGYFHMVYMDNVWDIKGVFNMSKEYLGYPTQKPEQLLYRIITASSNEGDIVLDPFCGCGTAIAAAEKLKRRWIGIDVSPTACKLMATRMHSINPQFDAIDGIIGMPRTLEEVKTLTWFDFQNWVFGRLPFGRVSEKRVHDFGIDGYYMGNRPVQVKEWKHPVGRVEVDKFETAMKRVKATEGMIVAFSFGKGAYEEAARVKNAEGLDIELRTVESLIEGE